LCAVAQEQETPQHNTAAQTMAAAFGLEWNMNSQENFAGAIMLGFDYNLPRTIGSLTLAPFAAGLTVTANNNFNGTTVIEPAALFRWYFLNKDHAGFFAQADIGAYLFIDEDGTIPLFLGGLRAGCRLPVRKMFFAEPYGRLGYPFAFGIGATAGIKF